MSRVPLRLALALAIAATGIPALAQSGATPADPDRARQGKALFDAVGCAGCHGYAGQGGMGPSAGPRINQFPAAALIAIIRRPPLAMPVFSAKVLPDDQVRLIGDYFHSLPAPPPASVTDPYFPMQVTGNMTPSVHAPFLPFLRFPSFF